ncbi:MAG: zinc-ribbon domain-containing protein, partial [Planctomycetota bacterium]
MFCPKCRTQLPEGSRFCYSCGAKISLRRTTKSKSFVDLDIFDSYTAPTSPRYRRKKMDFLAKNERFQILDTIGKGRLGVVYQAQDLLKQQIVALKRLHMSDKPTRLGVFRFLKNAPEIARLHHTNIIPIYDVGEDEESPYISMQLVEGQNLSIFRSNHQVLSDKEILRIGRQIARALELAHAQGIVHGAVKPSNVILESRGGTKVGDFGLSQIFVDKSARTLHSLGTDQFYIAPEVFADSLNLEPSADIYSLGRLLYYLAVGKESGPIQPNWVPQRLKRVILCSTEKNVRRRYQDMSEFLEDIEKALQGHQQILTTYTPAQNLAPFPSSEAYQASCGHINSKRSSFCGECGASLKRYCSRCGGEYHDSQETCPYCPFQPPSLPPAPVANTFEDDAKFEEWNQILESTTGSFKAPTETSSHPRISALLPPDPPPASQPSSSPIAPQPPPPAPSASKSADPLEKALFHNPGADFPVIPPPPEEEVQAAPEESEPVHSSSSASVSADEALASLLPPAQSPSPSPVLSPEKEKSKAEFLEMAQGFLETYKFEKAIQYSQKVLDIDPNCKQAQDLLRMATQKSRDLEVSLQKAKDSERQGDLKSALEHWKKALEIFPFQEEVGKKIQQLEEQIRTLEEKAKKAKNAVNAIENVQSYEDYVKSNLQKGQITKTEKELLIQQELKKAQQFLSNANYKEATQCAKKILKIDISNKQAQEVLKIAQEMQYILRKIVERATAYEKKADYQKALNEWSKLLKIAPNNKKILAKIKEVQGKIEAELEDIVSKAEAYFENREYRKVLLECQKILKLYPGHKYSKTLVEQSKEALKKAEIYLKKAKDNFAKKDFASTVKYAKMCLDIDWKKNEAQELLKKSIRFLEEKGDSQSRIQEAQLLAAKAKNALEQGNIQTALQHAQKALEYDPNQKQAMEILQQCQKSTAAPPAAAPPS